MTKPHPFRKTLKYNKNLTWILVLLFKKSSRSNINWKNFQFQTENPEFPKTHVLEKQPTIKSNHYRKSLLQTHNPKLTIIKAHISNDTATESFLLSEFSRFSTKSDNFSRSEKRVKGAPGWKSQMKHTTRGKRARCFQVSELKLILVCFRVTVAYFQYDDCKISHLIQTKWCLNKI